MILNCYVPSCQVVTKPEPRVTDKGVYHKIGIISGQSVGEMNCSPEVFSGVEVGKKYDFTFGINTDYDKVFISLKNYHECK